MAVTDDLTSREINRIHYLKAMLAVKNPMALTLMNQQYPVLFDKLSDTSVDQINDPDLSKEGRYVIVALETMLSQFI